HVLLLGGRALPPGDDLPGVSHAAPGRRCDASDEADDRLADVLLDESRSLLFGVPADLADHDDRFRLRVLLEHRQEVDISGADDRIATDPDAGRLAEPQGCELVDRLVRERPSAADHPHPPRLVAEPGPAPTLAVVRRADPR